MSVWAVLAAAGRGDRLGLDRPKAFAPLGDGILLAVPLQRLNDSDWIEGIVIAAPPDWEEPSILLAEELACEKVATAVTGGETRAESVRAALRSVPDDAAVILVHDAARPFVSEEVVARVLAPLSEGWDGVVPAVPVQDTVKRVRGEEVVETVDREGLMAAQTPQAFEASVLRTALGGDIAGATDCASLVEAARGRVRVVEGDPKLLKVTDPVDLEIVSAWID
ncbi:MAG TPA: 2-C-methyl-D-erythritol 4-phosphate cytidylyltransferase [Gaiellaceae bacterium]|nr:2-C-methyl-D-erythritol 4-phosphate cytidylyltransferase [Gaiellaceae bacterium]